MNLPAAGQGPTGVVVREKLEKAATILQNVFRAVFIEARKIESIVCHGTDATQARGETVYKTRVFQWRAD